MACFLSAATATATATATPTCSNINNSFISSSSPSSSSLRRFHFDLPHGRRRFHASSGYALLTVRASFHDLDSASEFVSRGFPELVTRAEGLLYTIADAAVSATSDAAVSVDASQQQNRDWLSGLTDGMESILKVYFFFFYWFSMLQSIIHHKH
mgnify:CR=1 FL=1